MLSCSSGREDYQWSAAVSQRTCSSRTMRAETFMKLFSRALLLLANAMLARTGKICAAGWRRQICLRTFYKFMVFFFPLWWWWCCFLQHEHSHVRNQQVWYNAGLMSAGLYQRELVLEVVSVSLPKRSWALLIHHVVSSKAKLLVSWFHIVLSPESKYGAWWMNGWGMSDNSCRLFHHSGEEEDITVRLTSDVRATEVVDRSRGSNSILLSGHMVLLVSCWSHIRNSVSVSDTTSWGSASSFIWTTQTSAITSISNDAVRFAAQNFIIIRGCCPVCGSRVSSSWWFI